jgi:glycosyltransferase involved in cell wall biosynthesis
MSTKNLVSIITPCYNGELFIHRLLDSVLEQNYSHIEHIIIDDGSTDRTAEIIQEYIPKYEKLGKKLIYEFQENAKAGAALNRGLKLFSGEYLTWPDSDDYYSSDNAISTMVSTLSSLPEAYGIVRCDAILLDEDTLSRTGKFSDNKSNADKEILFEDCILEHQFWYTPGCYFTSAKAFDSVVRNRDIFVNNDVQNWQMLLPVLYKYKCFYIKEPLHNYLVRSTSYCHQPIDYELAISRTFIHEEIINETLKRIEMPPIELSSYLSLVEKKYVLKRLTISFEYNNSIEFDKLFLKLKKDNTNQVTFKLKMKKLLIGSPTIISFIRKTRGIVKI